MNRDLPTIADAKAEARHLRAQRVAGGDPVSHGAALELVARHYGYRDWNTFRADLDPQSDPPWAVGDRVSGHYLGHPFEARVLAASEVREGWFRLSLEFDEAVDVVAFDSFSHFRKRVNGTVGPAGRSREQTSDGRPHLVIGSTDRRTEHRQSPT